MKETFYMVYVQDGNTPTYKHSSIEDAEKEAKRLAKQLNKKAFVLCSLKSFELNEFAVQDHRPDGDELPF